MCLYDSKFRVTVDEHIIYLLRLVLHGLAHSTTYEVIIGCELATIHRTSSGCLQLWGYIMTSRISFVHVLIVILPNKYGYFPNHSSISFSDNPC